MVTVLLERDGRAEVVLDAADELIDWLTRTSTNPSIRSLDPYGDLHLREPLLSSWFDSVTQLLEARRAETVTRLSRCNRLPQSQVAREQILGTLLERERKRDRILDQLTQLAELLDRARREGASVALAGD
jgi:hypothetical protein